MTAIFPYPNMSIAPTPRGTTFGGVLGGCSYSIGRLPSDPLYYIPVTLDNIVIGSRYRITRVSDGLELASGVAASTTEVITGVPVYSSNMLMAVTVRKASGSPNYKIFDTNIYANKGGVSAYILQQLDE